MKVSRKIQEEQIAEIDKQFTEFLLACGEHSNNRVFLEGEIRHILESVRNTVMTCNLDDDLLLGLFDKLGYVLEYAERLEPVEILYRLSA